MASDTHSSNFKSDLNTFKLILQDYDTLNASAIAQDGGLNTAISNLDSSIRDYANAAADAPAVGAVLPIPESIGHQEIPGTPAVAAVTATTDKRALLQAALNPISQYSAGLGSIITRLEKFIDDSSELVQDSQGSLINEERYINRMYPENSVRSREVIFGIFPQLRITSLPYIIAASIFMISLIVFLIFQMAGVTGQVNLPPSFTQWYSTPAVGSIPFYKNPMVLGGVIVLLLIIAVIFIILYAKSKNTNKD